MPLHQNFYMASGNQISRAQICIASMLTCTAILGSPYIYVFNTHISNFHVITCIFIQVVDHFSCKAIISFFSISSLYMVFLYVSVCKPFCFVLHTLTHSHPHTYQTGDFSTSHCQLYYVEVTTQNHQ